MQAYQEKFIQMCLKNKVLCFGEFTLKSGRISPYFFNAGLFNNGSSLADLGNYYAQAIIESNIEFDILFGPAYKGIPLVSTTVIALAHKNKNVCYAFNRKEAKDHGEGGMIVGAALQGKVLIVDDVITAGTAVRESMNIIAKEGAKPAGIVIAMDRQERGQGELSAVQEVEQTYNIPVISVIKLEHLLQFAAKNIEFEKYLPALEQYHSQYGI